MKSSGGHVIENAESARFATCQKSVDSGMVSGWAYDAESIAISTDKNAVPGQQIEIEYPRTMEKLTSSRRVGRHRQLGELH